MFFVVSIVFCQNQKIDSLLIEAHKSSHEGNTIKSIDLYLQVIEIDPTIYTSHFNLGINYYDIAEFKKAIEQYNIAEKIDNTNPNLYNNRGNAYSRLGDYDLAIKNHKKDIQIRGYPTDTLLYNIANIYWRMGHLDSAIVYFDKVIILNPKISEAYSNKAYVFLLKEDYSSAREAYENLLIKKPNSYNILNNLGYILMKQGDLLKALSYVNKSLSINPDNSWGYRNLGLIYKEKSDSIKACDNLKKALDLDFIKFWGEKDIKELMDYCK